MLKKQNMDPQTRIKVVTDFAMYTDDNKLSAGPTTIVTAGSELSVIHGPKKKCGINFAKVEDASGTQGYVFWCYLRESCEYVS